MAEQIYSLGEKTEQIEFKKSTGELKEAVISMAAIIVIAVKVGEQIWVPMVQLLKAQRFKMNL